MQGKKNPPPKIIHIWNTSESKKLRRVKTTDTDCLHSDEKNTGRKLEDQKEKESVK